MNEVSLYQRAREKLRDAWRNRALSVKAVTFALVGVVNTAVDYCVFLIGRSVFEHSPAALALFGAISSSCECGSVVTITLVAANTLSWLVAVGGSYIMNSTITFAAESGRKLRWSAFFTFMASGIVGWIANTATLLVVAEILLLPVWLAKLVAILASFVVNFSLSHFVVFRVRAKPAGDAVDHR